jgi:nitrate reductase gamma subunit
MEPFVAFIKGPMAWIAFGVFFGGLLVHSVRFFVITRKKDPRYLPVPAKPKKAKKKAEQTPEDDTTIIESINQSLQPLIRLFDKAWAYTEDSIFLIHPVVSTVTVVFHLLLFIIPIFLLAHNELFRGAVGFSLPSLPEHLADALTIVLMMCGGFFLLRRVFIRRVRAITTLWDYLVLIVTLTPFVSGFVAFHQWGDYQTVIIVHIVSGELALILIPFTKLNHMIYFFLYRLLIGSEYSFGQGKRVW